MPANPIELRAVLNLHQALQAITGADYHFPVSATAIKLDPNHAADAVNRPDGPRPFALLQMHPEKREYYPAGDLKVKLPFTIHWVNNSELTDDVSRVTVFYKGCADVEKAIALDIGRGGNASDTRIVDCRQDLGDDGKEVWAEIQGEIWFHRTYGLPNG